MIHIPRKKITLKKTLQFGYNLTYSVVEMAQHNGATAMLKYRKEYSCLLCDDKPTFKKKELMQIHKIRHNGKGWKCQFCSETYKISSRLKNHLVISHSMTEEVIEIFGILKLANKFVVMKKLKSSKIPAEKSKPLLSDSDLDSDETEDEDEFCIYDEEVSNLSDQMMATLTTLKKSQPIHGPSPE